MSCSDNLTENEAAIYHELISHFVNIHTAAENSMFTFKNPAIGANLKSAAAFIDAACTLIEYENNSRGLNNGKLESSGNTTATSQN